VRKRTKRVHIIILFAPKLALVVLSIEYAEMP